MQDKNSTWIKQIDKKKITNIKTGNKISRFEHGLQWQWNMQSDQWYNIIQKVNKGIMVWDKITKLNLKVENSKTEDENGQKEVQQRHTLNSEEKKGRNEKSMNITLRAYPELVLSLSTFYWLSH